MFSKLGPAAKYGLNAAILGGLTGGISSVLQGDSPSEQVGSALGGALLGGVPFALAGRYAPQISQVLERNLTKAGQKTSSILSKAAEKVPGVELEGYTGGLGTVARDVQEALQQRAKAAAEYVPSSRTIRNVGTGALATAGIGGVLAGSSIGSAIGRQFNQEMPVDPESYGSSNSAGARYKTPTTQYV
jgi:hypothetical protein